MDAYNPRTVEEVFRDFKGRRAGMIKALTTDVGEFFQQCDPGAAKKHTKEKSSVSNHSSKKSKSNSKQGSEAPSQDEVDDGIEEEDEDEHGEALCGACGENYAGDEFWICCDICEKWFHGKCVKITPAGAEHIKQYKCPSCSGNKSARPS